MFGIEAVLVSGVPCANRVKFSFDLLLGNVEPEIFPSSSVALVGSGFLPCVCWFGWPVAFAPRSSVALRLLSGSSTIRLQI